MKTQLFITCFLALPILTACVPNTKTPSLLVFDNKKLLDNVELDYPNVTFTFRSNREKHRSGDAFKPPKTIDCSNLTLSTDAFEDAIEAGALIVRIDTPQQVMQKIIDENGRKTTKRVSIKPVYGGVLALCKIPDTATGPDSRSYRIRGLDDYLVKGKGGRISVVGAVLEHKKRKQNGGNNLLGNVAKNQMGNWGTLLDIAGDMTSNNKASSDNYSWMLWLTDRKTTFTNYEAYLSEGSRLTGDAEGSRLASNFPWPPPHPSAYSKIPSAFLPKLKNKNHLKNVAKKLEPALDQAGYSQKKYYQVPDGFALVSQLEQFNSDGTSKTPPDRWVADFRPPRIFSLTSYLKALFTSNPGRYRIITFIVTSQPFKESKETVTRKEAMAWLDNGMIVLPESIGEQPYTDKHYCTAFIYEFEQPGKEKKPFFKPLSNLTGKDHLEKSKLWATLKQ